MDSSFFPPKENDEVGFASSFFASCVILSFFSFIIVIVNTFRFTLFFSSSFNFLTACSR